MWLAEFSWHSIINSLNIPVFFSSLVYHQINQFKPKMWQKEPYDYIFFNFRKCFKWSRTSYIGFTPNNLLEEHMIIYDHNYGFWMSNKSAFLLSLSLLHRDLGLSLYTLVSNFPKSSLNALNNTLRIIKKINRFSELTSAAKMLESTGNIQPERRRQKSEPQESKILWHLSCLPGLKVYF